MISLSILLLKSSFNCSNSFALSVVDRVTSETYSFCISYFKHCCLSSGALESIAHSLHQFNIRFTSQLISSISKILQKLLRHFNGTILLTFATYPTCYFLFKFK